jgi:hypothetical protein
MRIHSFCIEEYTGFNCRLIRRPCGGAILIRHGEIASHSLLLREFPEENEYLSDLS